MRTTYDLEMMREMASAQASRTTPATSTPRAGGGPFTLLDYFPTTT